jgi:glycine oxidase
MFRPVPDHSLEGARVLVAGAGAFGAAIAAELARRGASVLLVEPSAEFTGASAVAAGMIAPAFEALDPLMTGQGALLRGAADAWGPFAERHGLELRRRATRWRGPVEPLRTELEALGFAPTLDEGGFRVEGEAVIDAVAALRALRRRPGVTLRSDRVEWVGADGRARLREGGDWRGDAVVVATGAVAEDLQTAVEPLVQALGRVTPVKGQIVTLTGEGAEQTVDVLRAPDVYVAPQPRRVLVGATMEVGRTDAEVDADVIERLRAAAVRIAPQLAQAAVLQARAAVRGASPDGLPLVGPVAPGVIAALAPRRNGWLLAPLAAEVVCAGLTGVGSEFGSAFAPTRFDPS